MTEPEFTIEELNSEEWRLIQDFPDYEVSSLGRVRRKTASKVARAGHVLKPTSGTKGRRHVSLCRGAVVTERRIHRLVAGAFLEPSTPERIFINHKDGNPSNNRQSNLEWCTPKENTEHSIYVLGNRSDGEHNKHSKFTREQVLAIHDALMAGMSSPEIIAKYGVSESQISRIKKREVWKELLKDFPSDYPPPRRLIKGSRVGTSKLDEPKVQQIKQMVAAKISSVTIAARFGVSESTIKSIRLGQSWKHVT